MARSVKIQQYLDSDALEKRYRNAQDGVERSQWQMIGLLRMGKTRAEVAEVTGDGVDWLRNIVRRYNTGGPALVGDRRHHKPGQPRWLHAEPAAELLAELDTAAAGGQAWRSVQVAAWLSATLGRPIRQGRGWDTRQRLNCTTKTPRTRHAKAAVEEPALFNTRRS